jgi:hypothetical protein
MFEYFATDCHYVEVQEILDLKGPEGWRLHTCEPFGDGSAKVLIVMDRLVVEEEHRVGMGETDGIRLN